MQDIPQEKVIKRFQSLPESLQEAIFSQSGTDTVRKSCVLRDIPKSKISLIDQLTGRVLLGYLQPEGFAFEIQKEAGIDALKATQVAHDIDTEIFSEVRLELKKLYPPTIQTPTVQRPGFSGQESGAGFQDSRFKIQEQRPAPRYIVPIPEKFKGTSVWPVPKANEAVSAIPAIKATVVNEAPKSKEVGASHEAINYNKLKANEVPSMDPVVPLPTFIQSKFKASELGMAGQESKEGLRKEFQKFTSPSTDSKKLPQEPHNPYRETIEESKKPEPLRQAQDKQKTTPKIQGKVIDLSQF